MAEHGPCKSEVRGSTPLVGFNLDFSKIQVGVLENVSYVYLRRILIRKCLNCKEETKNAKYCNNKCQKAYEWKKQKEHIKKVKAVTTGPHAVTAAKKYLLETRGLQCEICKLREWREKPIPIILDHVNGKSDDWSLKNLRLICPNCDAQTTTYKNRNKGNGRHYRRQRYANGQSY